MSFRPTKKIAAAYFNIPGEDCSWLESVDVEHNANLIPAVKAGRDAFMAVYLGKDSPRSNCYRTEKVTGADCKTSSDSTAPAGGMA
jgi:hypothetical protein